MFLLVPAYPGCPGSKAVKWLLLLFQLKTHKVVDTKFERKKAGQGQAAELTSLVHFSLKI